MLKPAPLPIPLPQSSVNSAAPNSGNVIEAQPIGADEVDGVEPSNVEIPGNADAGDTDHVQHAPRGAAAPVRIRKNLAAGGSIVSNKK